MDNPQTPEVEANETNKVRAMRLIEKYRITADISDDEIHSYIQKDYPNLFIIAQGEIRDEIRNIIGGHSLTHVDKKIIDIARNLIEEQGITLETRGDLVRDIISMNYATYDNISRETILKSIFGILLARKDMFNNQNAYPDENSEDEDSSKFIGKMMG